MKSVFSLTEEGPNNYSHENFLVPPKRNRSMSAKNKSEVHLANQLKETQTEIARLKKEQFINSAIQKEKLKLEHLLRERIKELNCLYSVSKLIEENEADIDTAMQRIVNLLPVSWQFPEIATARIIIREVSYVSKSFRTSPWKQAANVYESSERIGAVEVYYLEEMPESDEGPFLAEERSLINAIAIRISRTIERLSAKKQLEVERKSLENANITLREILVKVKEEQNEIGKTIIANIDKSIMPILHALESEVYPAQQKYILLIQKNLEDITSPFISRLSAKFMGLTPAEIHICNMIKNGLSTKEIANLRHISHATVNRHRENIRKKLKIKNQKVNLLTYLQSQMND